MTLTLVLRYVCSKKHLDELEETRTHSRTYRIARATGYTSNDGAGLVAARQRKKQTQYPEESQPPRPAMVLAVMCFTGNTTRGTLGTDLFSLAQTRG